MKSAIIGVPEQWVPSLHLLKHHVVKQPHYHRRSTQIIGIEVICSLSDGITVPVSNPDGCGRGPQHGPFKAMVGMDRVAAAYQEHPRWRKVCGGARA